MTTPSRSNRVPHSTLVALALCLGAVTAFAQGTAITYQGRLADGAGAASGSFDFQFTIYNAGTGGAVVGSAVTTNGVVVSNGLFTATLDFGASPFNVGQSRWLQIEVRTNGAASFTALAPRQPLTPSPYALYAPSAGTAALANRAAAGSITSAALAPGSVTAAAIAPGAVSSLGALDGSPTNALVVNANGLVGIGTGTNPVVAGLQIVTGGTAFRPNVLFQVQDDMNGYDYLQGIGRVAVSGNLVAVASGGESAVTLIDVSNPASPVLRAQLVDGIGGFTALGGANGVAFKGNLLAVAAEGDSAVTLISVTNPAAPVKLSELRDGIGGYIDLYHAREVAFSTNNLLAVAATQDDAVSLIDVSNPSAPVLRGVIKEGFNGFTNIAGPWGLAFSGNRLAIASELYSTVTLADVSNPAVPVKLAQVADGVDGFDLRWVMGLAFSGNLLAMCADGAVTLVDVANPASPQLRSTIRSGAGGAMIDSARQAVFSGNLLAVAAWGGGSLNLIGVSNPSAPMVKGVFKTGFNGLDCGAGLDVAMVGTNFVGAAERSVSIIQAVPVTVNLAAQDYVGIGTAVPMAPLHVVGDMVVERAGRVALWADRVSLGQNAMATGPNSVAVGYHAMASGESAMTLGQYTVASGNASVALGNGTEASGMASTAMGVATHATAEIATVMGYYSVASGDYSTAMGSWTTASGYASTAMGHNATASGGDSTAMGLYTTASGEYSTAMGRNTTAAGNGALAAGRRAKANHEGAFVWADSTDADFSSTAVNQFLIRASGNVGINKNNPATALDVNGAITATGLALSGDARLNDREIFLRGDNNHGLGWYGATKPFGTATPDGPVLYGFSGGALGTFRGGTATNVALSWDNNRTVSVAGTLNANGALNVSGTLSLGGTQYLNDHDIQLRNDTFHGLGWYGAGKLYAGNDINGPAIYGGSGGVLGTRSGSTDTGVLFWKSSGNVGIGTFSPSQKLHVVGNIYATGTITPNSDRNLKTDFAPVDVAAVLDKVRALPIQQWRFTAESEEVKHVGPMAQDFRAAFGLGAIPTAIATVDADGVALAAIQGLNQKVEEQRAELKQRQTQITELEQRLEKLERLLNRKLGGDR